MKKPYYSSTQDYADCLERAFAPRPNSRPEAASVGAGSDVARALELGAMGNTPLSTSHLGKISEDTVHLSVWVDWGAKREEFFTRLRQCQLESQGKAEDMGGDDAGDMNEADYVDLSRPDIEFSDDSASSGGGGGYYIEGHGKGMFEFGGCLWKVLPHGMGGKDGRSYYPYTLASGGILMGFRRDGFETVSNLWVEMGSIPLATYGGLAGVWQELVKMFKAEGVTVVRDLVSRVDIYADFDHCGVGEFCERFHANKKVTRARKIGTYAEEMNEATYMVGRRYTGFSVGQNIKLRCYDKRLELQKDPIKWGVFAERYNGIPEVLTRVEFQLRRVALKEFLVDGLDRIDGVESYLKAREQLWRYLTEDWFRMTDDTVDAKNNHQSRAKTWTIWESVQKAVGDVLKEIFRHRRATKFDLDHLYKMAIGCVCKIAVWEKEEIESAGDILRHFMDKVRAHGESELWGIMQKHYDERFLRQEMIGQFGGQFGQITDDICANS